MFLGENKARGLLAILLIWLPTFIFPGYAQICTPPYPITDGSYDPVKDEYTYEDAVTYQCNGKKYVLKGESSVYCNADGDWNSDPPECIDVECPNPEVENAKKVTGFIGPYYHKSAVTFECSSGFTMKGFNFVTCNLNKQWDPPLPTCSKGNVAAAMGHGIFILTMILLGHVINPHF